MPAETQTPQNTFSSFTPFEQVVLSARSFSKHVPLASEQLPVQEHVDAPTYPDTATEWLISLLNLLTDIVNQHEDLDSLVVTEDEYQQLSAVLDDLIYSLGEDEDHPLSSVMTLIGLLIKAYGDQRFPRLVDLFPELAENTSRDGINKSKDITIISEQVNTNFADAFLSIGYLLSETGKGEKAISTYDLAIRVKPDYVQAYMNRGVAKYTRGDYKGAVKDHNKAIELNPDYPGHYTNRGNAKSGLGDHTGAIADHTKTIQLMPDYPGTYVNRGNVKFRLSQYKSAIDDYNAAINMNPDFTDAYVNRAQAKVRLSLFTDAKSDFQTALELAKQRGQKNLEVTIAQMIQKLDEIE